MSTEVVRARLSGCRCLGGPARITLRAVNDNSVIGHYLRNVSGQNLETLRVHDVDQIASCQPLVGVRKRLGVDVGTHVSRFLVEDADAIAGESLVQPRN